MGGEGYFERLWRVYPGGHGDAEPDEAGRTNGLPGWKQRAEKPLPGLGIRGNSASSCSFRTPPFSFAQRPCASTPPRRVAPGLTLVEQRGLGIRGRAAGGARDAAPAPQPVLGPVRAQLPRRRRRGWKPSTRPSAAAPEPGACSPRHENGRALDDVMVRAYYSEVGALHGPARAPSRPRRQSGSPSSVVTESDDRIRGVIVRSCQLLDEERFDDYLALWSAEGPIPHHELEPGPAQEARAARPAPAPNSASFSRTCPNHERMSGNALAARHRTARRTPRRWGDGRARPRRCWSSTRTWRAYRACMPSGKVRGRHPHRGQGGRPHRLAGGAARHPPSSARARTYRCSRDVRATGTRCD